MKALIIEKTETKPVYHDAKVRDVPKPVPTEGQVLIAIDTVSFNHRELWIRKGQYPGILFGSIMGADGCGKVESTGKDAQKFKAGDRVVVMPAVGWNNDPRGPEEAYYILGGGHAGGIMADYIAVDEENVFPAPEHLSDIEAAALPLAGLTAYRAVFTKGLVKKGQNVLIPGIGGGVALFALSFCVAAGANVYVTSSDDSKIQKAIAMGAKGGVNYKNPTWGKDLGKLMAGEQLDAVIDGAGGDGTKVFSQLLRLGGIIVNYGMTVQPQVTFTMAAVLKNLEVKGSTMGSRAEFVEMLEFVNQHQVKPVVSNVWNGLDSAEEAFETMKKGTQFGKLVLSLSKSAKL